MKKKITGVRLIGLAFIILGVLSLIYFLIASAFRVASSRFFVFISIPLILLGVFKLFLTRPIKSKPARLMLSVLHKLVFLGFLSFLIIEFLIISSAFEKSLKKPDYIVILGAGLWGNTPSLALIQRLDAALELIKANPDTKIVVSGGQGPNESTTEANAMKKILVERGVPENLIIKEEKSTSTLENLCFTRDTIRKSDSRQDLNITIVTSNFHVFRSKFLARRVGFKAQGYSADIIAPLIPAYFIREYMAIIKSFLLDNPRKVPPLNLYNIPMQKFTPGETTRKYFAEGLNHTELWLRKVIL